MKKLSTLAFSILLVSGFLAGCSTVDDDRKPMGWVPKDISRVFGVTPEVNWNKTPETIAREKSKSDTQKQAEDSNLIGSTSGSEDESKRTDYVWAPQKTTTALLGYRNKKQNAKERIIQEGDTIVMNYLGQVYGKTKPFDTTFTKEKGPIAVQLGKDQTIKAIQMATVGRRAGQRIITLVMPTDGYGIDGNKDAGIAKDDMISFVIDIIASYPSSAAIPKTGKPTNLKTQVLVSGEIGTEPNVTLIDNAKMPNSLVSTVLIKGKGKKVVNNDYCVLSYKSETWSGTVQANTYTNKTFAFQQIKHLSNSKKSTIFSQLINIPVGSRVLIQTPAKTNNYPALVTVVDILAFVPKDKITPPKADKINKVKEAKEKAKQKKQETEQKKQAAEQKKKADKQIAKSKKKQKNNK